MRRGFIKALLAFGAITVGGAVLALTGAGAAPPSGPQGPTVTRLDPVTPAVFRHSVHTLPQIGLSREKRPKPGRWDPAALVPAQPKTTLPGAPEPQQAAALASAPAP